MNAGLNFDSGIFISFISSYLRQSSLKRMLKTSFIINYSTHLGNIWCIAAHVPASCSPLSWLLDLASRLLRRDTGTDTRVNRIRSKIRILMNAIPIRPIKIIQEQNGFNQSMETMNNTPTHVLLVYVRAPTRSKCLERRAAREGTFDLLEGPDCFDCVVSSFSDKRRLARSASDGRG